MPIPLDLMHPLCADRRLVDEHRQTRFDPTRQRRVEEPGLARVDRLRDDCAPRSALGDGVGLAGLDAKGAAAALPWPMIAEAP